MKIGILTYHCVPNFGAELQALSTVGFFRQLGYEPIVLHWYPRDLEEMYSKRIPQKQMEIHNQFALNHLPLSKRCYTEDDLVTEINRLTIDFIFVGSDALFKYKPEKNRRFFSKRKLKYIYTQSLSVEKLDGNPFFGGFISKLQKKVPACAFSVSSQNCPFQQMGFFEKRRMSKALSNFSSITVRDEWTKKMVEAITKQRNIKITPDPVFSFNENLNFNISKEDIIRKFHLKEKYILLSFSNWYIDQSYIQEIGKSIEENGYQPVILPMPERCNDFDIITKIDLPLDPLDWYYLIKYSSGYIGERMHPIVVSLHNAIPFFCFDEYGFSENVAGELKYIKASSKTYLILKKAELTNWMCSYQDKTSTLPSASSIINKIKDFPIEKCKNFSLEYQNYYEKSMTETISVLIKK